MDVTTHDYDSLGAGKGISSAAQAKRVNFYDRPSVESVQDGANSEGELLDVPSAGYLASRQAKLSRIRPGNPQTLLRHQLSSSLQLQASHKNDLVRQVDQMKAENIRSMKRQGERMQEWG